jgi:PGF-CTERM protein
MRTSLGVLVAALVVLATLAAPPAAAQQDTVALTVSVLDQERNAVAGASLEATWSNGSTTAETASNGRAFLDVPRGADVTVAISHPDYVRNQRVEVEDATERDVEIPVWEAGQMTLRVQENGTSAFVSDASVRVEKGSYSVNGSTDDRGAFRTDTIEQGTYTVEVRKPGYRVLTSTIDVDGEVSPGVTLSPGSVNARFRVVDDHFDEERPIQGATVTVTWDGAQVGSVQTLADGEQGTGVPVNTELQLAVEKDGYVTNETTVSVGETERRYAVVLRRTPEITVGALSTRVVAGETTIIEATDEYGDPVVGATVRLDGEAVGRTGEDGSLRVAVGSPGEHSVTVTNGDLSSEPLTVTAISGDTTTTAAPATTTAPTTTATTVVTTAPTTTATTAATTTTAAATTTATTTATATESGGSPGFGLAVALAALLGAALLARRTDR